MFQQESIPVGCVPPTCADHTFFTTRCQHQWGRGPEVNKFEQVSSDGYQMSLAGGQEGPEVPCLEGNPIQ